MLSIVTDSCQAFTAAAVAGSTTAAGKSEQKRELAVAAAAVVSAVLASCAAGLDHTLVCCDSVLHARRLCQVHVHACTLHV